MPLCPVLRVGVTIPLAGAEVSPTGQSVIGVVAQGNGVSTQPPFLPGGQQPVTPAVPATTVNATNTNLYAVNVTITGGTLTAVLVNGVQVGTTPGTYSVPAGQTISITYSVQPTWAWVNPFPVPALVNTTTTYTAGQTVPVAAVTTS